MKILSVITNTLLLGVLVHVALYNTGDTEFLLMLFLFFTPPVFIVTLYGFGWFRNLIIKWAVLTAYLLTAIFLLVATPELLREDSSIFITTFIATNFLALIACLVSLLYVYNHNVPKISLFNREGKRKIEEDLYLKIAEEIESGEVNKALWTKAISFSDGSQDNTKSAYIRLRIKDLKKQSYHQDAQDSQIAQPVKKTNETVDWLFSANALKRALAVSFYSIPGLVTLTVFFYIASLSIYLEFFVTFIISVAIWFFSNSKIIWRIILILTSLGLSFLFALPLYFLSVFTLFGTVVFSKTKNLLLSDSRLLRSLSVVSHIYISSITIFLPVTVVSRYYEQDERLFAYIAPFVVIFFIYLFLSQNYEQNQGRWLTSNVSWLRMFSITLHAMPLLIILVTLITSLIYGI